MPALRIGSRGSPLARIQAETVVAMLADRGMPATIVIIRTQGDEDLRPVSTIGVSGLFTSALQQQLLAGNVDLAVHSLKDLPTESDPRLALAAVPPRGSVCDVLVSGQAGGLAGLPSGARVGTGSLRRRAQLLSLRPDLAVVDVRGNVETRVAMVQRQELDAVVLAEAGLQRLGMSQHISEVLDPTQFLPAAGQGALAIEVRADDPRRGQIGQLLNDPATWLSVQAERACLRQLHGGCQTPVGAWARPVAEHTFRLDAVVMSLDGRTAIRGHSSWQAQGSWSDDLQGAADAGLETARLLHQAGASRLLQR